MRKRKLFYQALLFVAANFLLLKQIQAQVTFPVNGIANPMEDAYAFVDATIIKDSYSQFTHATLLIRNKKIVAVGNNITIPKDFIIIDCKGKYLYPSFIDLYSSYGITVPQKSSLQRNRNAPYQFTSNTKGAFGWNEAIKPEVNASELFSVNDKDAKPLRDAGFGVELTHMQDGIARGTGTLVTPANEADNLVMLKEKASAQYSLAKELQRKVIHHH
jgi:hypothetical protein